MKKLRGHRWRHQHTSNAELPLLIASVAYRIAIANFPSEQKLEPWVAVEAEPVGAWLVAQSSLVCFPTDPNSVYSFPTALHDRAEHARATLRELLLFMLAFEEEQEHTTYCEVNKERRI